MWLDWDQAQVIERHFDADGNLEWVSAERDGYKRAGVLHRRILACTGPDRWTVTDQLIPIGNDPDRIHLIGLSWLMPDGKWELDGRSFWLQTLNGWAHLKIEARSGSDIALATSVVRAGKLEAGESPVKPTQGWYSPTYAVKVPSLAFIAQVSVRLPITLQTEWDLTGVVLPPDSQPVERPTPAS
jgi:hypothetical protein